MPPDSRAGRPLLDRRCNPRELPVLNLQVPIMKTSLLRKSVLAIAGITLLTFLVGRAAAQEPTTATQPAAQLVAASQPAPELSYGVPQVLQLVQAKVSDDIIVNFIQNSGTIYALQANEIVYLKQQGMSDTVLNAMLNQRSRLASSTAPAPAAAASASASYTPPAATAQPAAVYAPSAQSSMVYVIPDTQTYRYNAWFYGATPYYYYPYYGGYYGWPAVSLSFGWGNYNGGSYHYYGGGYHGGYYGGWRGGGGYPPAGSGGGYRGGGGGGHPPGGGGGGRH